jgi:hypothetical protein
MATQHFTGCRTLDAVSKRMKELAKQHHPDLGGNVDTMKDVGEQYAYIKHTAKYGVDFYPRYITRFPADAPNESDKPYTYDPNDRTRRGWKQPPPGKTYDENGLPRYGHTGPFDELDAEITYTLIELSRLAGLEVEVIGTWIWVSGNTYAHKDALWKLGLNWSASRKMWYFKGVSNEDVYERPKRETRETRDDGLNGARRKYGTGPTTKRTARRR